MLDQQSTDEVWLMIEEKKRQTQSSGQAQIWDLLPQPPTGTRPLAHYGLA